MRAPVSDCRVKYYVKFAVIAFMTSLYYYKRKKRRKFQGLYSRILIRLTVPLLFLAVVFTTLQLTNQMNAMNESYKIESRFIFDSIQKALDAEFKREGFSVDSPELAKTLETMKTFHQVASIEIYDLFEKKPLTENPEFVWDAFDLAGAEESIYHKTLGKPYHIKVDKAAKRLVGYIPVDRPGYSALYIARAIYPLASLRKALSQSVWTLLVTFLLIALTGVLMGYGLAKSIANPLKALNEATREIVKGNLNRKVPIHTGDEIGALGDTFNQMVESLNEMKKRAEDSNPLTQLPGNQGIFHEIRRRLHERQKFVLFHIDLDRFKVFNDHYGLARGDEAIQKTARLLKDVVKEKGAADDFVGHQGGDDFVLTVQPQHAREIAETLVKRFDHEIVRSLYRKDDYDQGYTLQVDRRRLAETGEEVTIKFPLLSISLAGVSNVKKDFADYFECMSSAVEVKKEAKKTVTSSYVIKE
ncbi:MAG: HAMP domain-containing protein [Candidatus Omnitrophica bacterium]|nr:HAMP domain-containing protein [Candidatus Omnitrophota bacterium]